MAKRGRKPLISDETKVDYGKVMCYHCNKEINNSDGKADYKTHSVWKDCSGAKWPITVRLHKECLKTFQDENKDNTYGGYYVS